MVGERTRAVVRRADLSEVLNELVDVVRNPEARIAADDQGVDLRPIAVPVRVVVDRPRVVVLAPDAGLRTIVAPVRSVAGLSRIVDLVLDRVVFRDADLRDVGLWPIVVPARNVAGRAAGDHRSTVRGAVVLRAARRAVAR